MSSSRGRSRSELRLDRMEVLPDVPNQSRDGCDNRNDQRPKSDPEGSSGKLPIVLRFPSIGLPALKLGSGLQPHSLGVKPEEAPLALRKINDPVEARVLCARWRGKRLYIMEAAQTLPGADGRPHRVIAPQPSPLLCLKRNEGPFLSRRGVVSLQSVAAQKMTLQTTSLVREAGKFNITAAHGSNSSVSLLRVNRAASPERTPAEAGVPQEDG